MLLIHYIMVQNYVSASKFNNNIVAKNGILSANSCTTYMLTDCCASRVLWVSFRSRTIAAIRQNE